MATAYETYTSLEHTLSITDTTPHKDALRDAKFFVGRVQHQVLASQPDGYHRQLYGILFAHALHMFDLPEIYDEPQAWSRREEAADPRKPLRTGALASAVILFLVCCVHLYGIGEWLPMVGLCICALLLLAHAMLTPSAPKEQLHVTQRINTGRLRMLLENTMRAIDRDMDAIDLLLPGEGQNAVPEDALDLAAKVFELDRAGIEPVPPTLVHAIDLMLLRQGITTVEYTVENAPLFQTLPTQRETRTLVPAMLHEGHLVRSGLAILSGPEQEG